MHTYIIDDMRLVSHVRHAFSLRRFLKKVSPLATVLLVGMTLWLCQMIVAIASVPVMVTHITLN